ncbi:MAG: hypothetical protein AAB597_01500 [Patescibacteria group bacterium]
MISIDDFKKLEIRIGEILSAEKVEGADKLLKFSVDFGSELGVDGVETRQIRQIISGIALHVGEPSSLVGRKFPFIVNLEPRVIRGLESQGMILAAGGDSSFSLLSADPGTPPGTPVK